MIQKLIKEIEQIDFAGISGVLSVCHIIINLHRKVFFSITKLLQRHPPPIIVYNVPGRTVINIEAHTTL